MKEIKFEMENINLEELVDFACKGIRSEIEENEKTIREGNELIRRIENGQKVKTKLTIPEIRAVMKEAAERIEELGKKRFDYNWEVALRRAE